MKRIMALVCMLAMLVGMGAMILNHSLAAPPKKGESAKTKGVQSKARGEEPNIKNEHERNDRNAKVPAPSNKGGAAVRGQATGTIHVNNETQWYVRVYADGDYIGTVGPYGDLYRYADAATWSMFARASFDDSDDITFGPSTLRVYSGSTSTWTLTN